MLLLSRLSAVSLELDDSGLRRELLELLQPWSAHVAVESNAWWCDGPVSLWEALLYESLGEITRAHEPAEEARIAIDRLHDVRARRRLGELMKRLDHRSPLPVEPSLSIRETEVLRLLSGGATNSKIAEISSYSVSTVRNDTMAIYRKLGVNGRAEAVARAMSLGMSNIDELA